MILKSLSGMYMEIIGADPNKRTMVLLHGLLGSVKNWKNITENLEERFNILLVDQRGHGRSVPQGWSSESQIIAKDFSKENVAKDILEAIEEYKRFQNISGEEKVILVGHSMGAKNALAFADIHTEYVESLVLEDMGPDTTFKRGEGLVKILESIPTPFENLKAAKEFMLNPPFDSKLGAFLYTRLTQTPSGVKWDFPLQMVREIISEGQSRDYWAELARLKCPVLCVRGEHSLDFTRQEFEKLKSMKNSSGQSIECVEIPGAGHWVHYDNPKEFIRALQQFLIVPGQ